MTTPMRRQYLRIKQQYPDTVVFFRLGDFYETFDADAKVVAQVCDIVLTSRPVGKDQRVPLAGVPYHAAEGYVAKLLAAGHKVAIVEQVGDVTGRGLVDREVVRVVTPGTLVEPDMLEARRNNYLAALVSEANRAGLAYVDISTGEFAATQLDGAKAEALLREELARLQPSEVLVRPAQVDLPLPPAARTDYEAWHFDLETAERALLEQFEVGSLEGFGLARAPMATCAAGAIVQYLRETQQAALSQLKDLHTYSTSQFMVLDPATRRNLELSESIRRGTVQGSLLGVLDRTVTAMGGRRLRAWISQPLLDADQLQRRLDAVEALVRNTPTRTGLRTHLRAVVDLERLTNRAIQGMAGPRDLLGIQKSLGTWPEVIATLEEALDGSESPEMLQALAGLDPANDVTELITRAIADEPPATLNTPGAIRTGFSAERDNIVASSQDAKAWVANLEKHERERTGIKSLKVGYNKVFGYYLEVTKANVDRVPEEYIRKQTLVNAERYITPDLKEYESLILNAQERLLELERRIFQQVVEQVAAAGSRLLQIARALGRLDVLAALAEVALLHRYVRPALCDGDAIDIVAGRHPVVEVSQREEPFVPNDAHLSAEESILVITGPNMSGKSTYLRQVALIVLMAQIGSFVPADEARIGLVDRIFTRIGAQDEISAGQSTFMVEMVETANILHHATSHSLLVLDEIGRGTSTYDGISIAWAVVEYVHNHPRLRAKTLFATHYHELTQLAGFLPHVRNYNVAVAEEGNRVVFLRKIVPGGADQSYGIHVAQLAGLPKPVIHRAEEILQELEQGARAPGTRRRVVEVRQLPLFVPTDPVTEELRELDVSSMTPLEALTKLYELQKRVS
jgi:DNA mismatch repair protein MutS